MKRWQARGEVEDSEDDELSLDGSPSPEPPRKRQKQSEIPVSTHSRDAGTTKNRPQNDAAEEAGDEAWLHPRVGKTYGKKATHPKQASPVTGSTADLARPRITTFSPRRVSIANSPPQNAVPAGSSSPVLQKPRSQHSSSATGTPICLDVPKSSPQERATTGVFAATNTDGDLASDSDDLPDAQTFLGEDAARQIFGTSTSTSALSSPLSERALSPLFVGIPRAQAPVAIPQSGAQITTAGDVEANVLSADEAAGVDPPPSVARSRRNLRDRKPEQLNPYQIERLRYLKQCRARGVQPVKVVEREVSHEESQSASQSSRDQEDAGFHEDLTSAAQEKVDPGRSVAFPSLNYFDTTDDSSDGDVQGHNRPAKRAKIRGKATTGSRVHDTRKELDEFDVPPSPPQTSSNASTSDEMIRTGSRRPAPGFIVPPGFTPAPLPTPQISSEVRHVDRDSDADTDQTRHSDGGRRLRTSSIVSASSGLNDEDEFQSRELRREQKRIRGVLPASWLRLDLHARADKYPRPLKERASRHIDHEAEPQKGVARQIKRGGTSTQGAADMPIWSEDETDSNGSLQAATPVTTQSPSRRLSTATTLATYERLDDDLMENDFVDPMLAGGSSRLGKRKKKTRRQPRITEAFGRSSNRQHDISEERVRSSVHARNGHSRARKTTTSTRPKQQRHSHVRLSIADLSESPSMGDSDLPSFIKLALRRARRIQDYGRHSPSGKHIRLATAEDTEDASSVLRAWRNGSIAPRAVPDLPTPPTANRGEQQHLSLSDVPSTRRRQQTFASPVKKSRVIQQAHLPVPTRRTRQLRLEPTRLERTSNDLDRSHNIQSNRSERTRWQPNVQRLREAQLETLERDFDEDHRTAVFERRMQCLTENVALPARRGRASDVQLDRYLQDLDTRNSDTGEQQFNLGHDTFPDNASSQRPIRLPHRSRKGAPRRLDIDNHDYRQLGQRPPEGVFHDDREAIVTESSPTAVLQGLGSFGTRYPVDFDMRPLPVETHFPTSTFIGSGDFESVIRLNERDLDRPSGHIRVCIDDIAYEWGAWTEEVSTQFSWIPRAVKRALQTPDDLQTKPQDQCQTIDRNVDYLLRSAVRYCSNCLYFLDTVDRRFCAQRLEKVVAEISEVLNECSNEKTSLCDTFIRIRQYQLVLTKVALQLCDHPTISYDCRERLEEVVPRLARSLASEAITSRSEGLERLYKSLERSSVRDSGVQENWWALSSIVILNHTLQDRPTLFWQAVDIASGFDIDKLCVVGKMEKVWHALFLVLPALEIDSSGITRVGSRLSQTQEDWSVVKLLVSRVLELYESSSQVRGFTVNDYVRTLLTRIHNLVNQWGWWKCEPLLNLVYDFFAQRNLGLLRCEEGHGSPKFLEELAGSPSFEVLPDDRSFHIFLKLLASSLLGMKKHRIYKDGKITGIAWRLLPNHSRTCRKDVDLQRSELEALRNHYDLLCTLYYAMPPGRRISIDTPRTLVDQATSHREACRLSVRAWANMTSFQMSTDEPAESLEPLVSWFTEILKINMAQFRLAKIEAERAKQDAEIQGVYIETAILESTIAKNQTEIAKTIVDALAGLKRALASASNLRLAYALLRSTLFWTVFELFDASQQRVVNAMLEALQVIETAIDIEYRLMTSPAISNGTSEESQDFGDSSALQEFVAAENVDSTSSPEMASILILPLSHFVSNVFGADISSDDCLLERLVDVWVRLAAVTVRDGKNTWSSYVDEYSTTSWNQMRDTVQKRKFAAYFMAKVVEQSGTDIEVVQRAMTIWLLSLVEREAMLKFQHILTSTLLNCCHGEPLLHNLPFAGDRWTSKFDIRLHDVRQRRVALISSVLYNIRREYDEVLSLRPSRTDEVKSAYRSMLRQLMQQMKMNYQELQTSRSCEVAEANIQGAYVEFVQQIVSALQQHVSGICQVDRFFTDSSAFPLPATDPTYVVGRLRSYIPKLLESRTRIQLAVFIQTVSERAATDGQQAYLTRQLVAAVKAVRELGSQESPTLRHVLLTSIVPAYIDASLNGTFTWILALPMLEACQQVLRNLLYDVQIESDDSVLAATEILSSILDSILRQFETVSREPNQVLVPYVLRTISKSVDVATSSLTLAAFIKRSASYGEGLQKQLKRVCTILGALQSYLEGSEDVAGVDYEPQPVTRAPWPDTRLQADKQIRDAMASNWSTSNGRYFVRRGNTSKEVVVELEDVNEERSRLLHSIKDFHKAFNAAYSPRCRKLRMGRGDEAVEALIV